MPEVGKLTAVFDVDTKKFDSGLKGVAAKVTALDTTFKGLTGGVVSATSSLSGLASPMTLIAGGAVVAASAIGGLASGLFELVKSSAKAGGELFDLSQKTGFAVETLSTLSIVAQTTGSDIKGISASLGIFQKNMEAAGDVTSKQGQLFKSLNIDTKNNEKALTQVFAALGHMEEGAHQTAIAMQFFGRSGKDVLAMIKETNGNLPEAIRLYKELGLVITKEAARAADHFNDTLRVVELQLAAVSREIGTTFLPVVTGALQDISDDLKHNQTAWANWGEFIITTMNGVRIAFAGLVSTLANLSTMGPMAAGLGVFAMIQKSREIHSVDDFNKSQQSKDMLNMLDALTPKKAAGGVSIGGGGGGGRGGGGARDRSSELKRIAELEIRIQSEALKTEEDDIEHSYDKRLTTVEAFQRAISGIEKNRHQMILDGLQHEEEAANKITDSIKRDAALKDVELKKIEEMNRHKQAEWQLEDKIKSVIRERVALTETLVKLAQRTRFASDVVLQDLGGGSVVTSADATRPRTMAEGKTRGRIATVEEQVMRERIQMIREQMQQLGSELTDIFAHSVETGFSKGIKAGLAELATGLLQIVEQIFLRRLADGLGQLLGNIATKTGGGLVSKILGVIFGGISFGGGGGAAAGLGLGALGGAAGGIGRASGGPMWPGNVYRVHKDETIIPMASSYVIPKGGMGGQNVVNNFTINLPADRRGSYSSPRSKRQLAQDLMAAIQGAHV